MVEHRLAKAGVASSNLVSRSIHSSIAQSVEQSAVNRSVVGSSPVSYTHLDVYKRQRVLYRRMFLMSEEKKLKIEKVDIADGGRYGKFVCEPLDRGYGITQMCIRDRNMVTVSYATS